MNHDFQIGDTVFAEDFVYRGIGRIICKDEFDWYGVRFNEAHESLHTLDGHCDDRHGRWYTAYDLDIVCDNASDDDNIDLGGIL